jgi:epoxyqueuosine reductase
MNAEELTMRLTDEARRLGFALAGACPAVTPAGIGQFGQWLDRGYGGHMDYLVERRAAYEHPRHVLDGARSILMLAMEYATAEPQMPRPGQGRISRYAWSPVDYHDVIHERLKALVATVKELAPGATARGVVDSAPLLEREFAQLAGLGWVGKNTLLLNKHRGSYFFLAALLTDQELAYDEPFAADHCGTCTACLDACPTKAFPQPYVLDATRCISYLTIELRDSIPEDLRPGIDDWLFGCDICQEVCPWNKKGSGFRVQGSGENSGRKSIAQRTAMTRLWTLDLGLWTPSCQPRTPTRSISCRCLNLRMKPSATVSATRPSGGPNAAAFFATRPSSSATKNAARRFPPSPSAWPTASR